VYCVLFALIILCNMCAILIGSARSRPSRRLAWAYSWKPRPQPPTPTSSSSCGGRRLSVRLQRWRRRHTTGVSASLSGFSTADSEFVSIVRRARMVSRKERDLDWFEPPRSNTLRPVSSCRVPELGVLVVGVTRRSGEGVEPKSLVMVFNL
jgi:hypothetical protein